MSKKVKVSNNPKWGTPEWIKAHPWSEMDKDRKRRVRKFLGFDPDEAPMASDLYHTVKRMLDKVGIKMSKDYEKRVEKTFQDADKFIESSFNDVVAYLLTQKQSLGKPCKKCGKDCGKDCKCHRGK